MTLIKSISGIRGTIGGEPGNNLTPIDIVKFTAAYGTWLQETIPGKNHSVVVGRDARISGEAYSKIVTSTLQGLGINVIDLGLSTTPTVEVMVPMLEASGGIILTASHNPKEWNALKLLNYKGEFISATDGEKILQYTAQDKYSFADVDSLGSYVLKTDAISIHIDKILALPLVKSDVVASKKWKIVVDAVNSTGGISVLPLLEKLGVECIPLYCTPNGIFPHNPEPLPEHLTHLSEKVRETGANLGISVDPDVDRLAIVCEDGSMFGEEYTLVAVADYVLNHKPGATVSNLSSSRALKDITLAHNQQYYAAAVGEVNVVEKMKEVHAVIGGEGNGGIIYPSLHYGRDALVGIALFLTHLAESNKSCLELRKSYPSYYMAKEKIELTPDANPDKIIDKLTEIFKTEQISTIDGLKIDFEEGWVHIRKSNTEPILRLYSEGKSREITNRLTETVKEKI